MGQNEHQLEDQTRAKLLETARAMVLRGDTKFSVTVLCAEAGVERALFHTHFTGKTALMAALMQTQSVPAAAPMAQSQPAPESKPVEAPAATSTTFQPVSKAEQTSEPGVPTPDAWLERRLRVFERALNALETKAETTARDQARAIAQLQEKLQEQLSAAPVPVMAATPPQAPAPVPVVQQRIAASTPPPQAPQVRRVEPASAVHESGAPEIQAQAGMEPAKPVPELPALAPLPVASKEEMADVLQTAREKARAAGEPEAEPVAEDKRSRMLTAGAIAAVALLVCVGLAVGKNFLSNNANAQAKSDGVTQRQQASSALAKTTALADAGIPRAQARLALAYLRGQGSAGDANAALLWTMSAAKAGDPVGQYLLGALYQQGDHVNPDPELAFVWFTRAAEKGNLKAMHNLAIAYAHGQGTATDEAKAVEWFTRAAERGYVDSAFDLAVLYERGIGVEHDLKQSLKWYGIAALAGDAPSKERAEILRGQLKPADVKLADAAAMAFTPLAALSGANNL